MAQADLQEVFGDDYDVFDPSWVERALMNVYKIQDEDDEYMQLLGEKLNDAMITWEQPWYQKTSKLTRCLNQVPDENVEQFRTDSITKEEHDYIEKRWLKLVKKYNLPNKLTNFARWKNSKNLWAPEEKTKRFIVAYLSKGLPRPLHKVYCYIRTHYGCPVKGPYSELEEKIMEIYFHHFPENAVRYLSLILGREPRGLYKRFGQKINGKPIKKRRLKWDLTLASKFLNLLMKYTGFSLRELKDKRFDTSVWMKLEADMDQYCVYLKKFWYNYLHVQLFVRCKVQLKKLRRKIFKKLRLTSCKVWTDIRWKELLNYFPDGFTFSFIYCVSIKLVVDYPNYLKAPLEDLIDHVLKRIKSLPGKHLRTLTLNKDGFLEPIEYEK